MSIPILTKPELKKYLKKLQKKDIAIDPSIYKKYQIMKEMIEENKIHESPGTKALKERLEELNIRKSPRTKALKKRLKEIEEEEKNKKKKIHSSPGTKDLKKRLKYLENVEKKTYCVKERKKTRCIEPSGYKTAKNGREMFWCTCASCGIKKHSFI